MSTKACLLQEIDWFLLEDLFALIPEHLGIPGEACAERSQERGLSTLDGNARTRKTGSLQSGTGKCPGILKVAGVGNLDRRLLQRLSCAVSFD